MALFRLVLIMSFGGLCCSSIIKCKENDDCHVTLQPEAGSRTDNPASSPIRFNVRQAQDSHAVKFGDDVPAAEVEQSTHAMTGDVANGSQQRIRMSEDLQQQQQKSSIDKGIQRDYAVQRKRRSIWTAHGENDSQNPIEQDWTADAADVDQDSEEQQAPGEAAYRTAPTSKMTTSVTKRNMSWLTAAMLSICLDDPCKCSFSSSTGGGSASGGGVGSSYRSQGIGMQLGRQGRSARGGGQHSSLICPPSSAASSKPAEFVTIDAKRKSDSFEADLSERSPKRIRSLRYGVSGLVDSVDAPSHSRRDRY